MDKNDKIWLMMARSVSGEISKEEQDELNHVLENNPLSFQHFLMLRKVWGKNLIADDSLSEEQNENVPFKRIISKAEQQRQIVDENPRAKTTRLRISKFLIYSCAASFALFAVFFFNKRDAHVISTSQQVVAAQNGSRSKVLLPDGSSVWLNGGSKLYYDGDFLGPTREVRLIGEARFDVAKQQARPFIVHTGDIDIKVHGTVFNVKYYQGDANIETTLLEGKIEVFDNTNKTQPPVFLVPNQKLIIHVEKALEPIKVNTRKTYELINLDTRLSANERMETAWVYNRIEFRAERFSELAKRLERWYNVTIDFENDSLKALTFNGSFEKETADEAFSALQKVGNFNYNIKGREVFIKPAN